MIELAERIQTENKELGTQIMGSRLALLSRSVSRFVFPFLEKNYVENYDSATFRQACRNFLVRLCDNPTYEKDLMDEIDAITHVESITAAEREEFGMDVLIVGTGPAGVIFANRYRANDPHADIWMVDKRPYRGGQFADGGYDYSLNSPNEGPSLGFPGELQSPNYLGDDPLLQINDISDGEFPTKEKTSCIVKIDGFLAAPAMTNTRIMWYEIPEQQDRYIVHAYNYALKKEVTLYPKLLVFAPGQGSTNYGIDLNQPETQCACSTQKENIHTTDEINKVIEFATPEELLTIVQNGLALIGGRDAANIALEAIINKLSRIISDDEIKQLTIDVYGARYKDAEEFQETIGTDRYNNIIPYIGNLIRPHKEKATGISSAENERIGIQTHSGEKTYGKIAFMTGYRGSDIENMMKNGPEGIKLHDVYGDGALSGEIIAQQMGDENIFVVGVGVKEVFARKIPRFARSIRRHTPRVIAIADKIAQTFADQEMELVA